MPGNITINPTVQLKRSLGKFFFLLQFFRNFKETVIIGEGDPTGHI
jgi:hypothetical protein